MKSQAAIILLAYALSSLSPISGLDITDWDVSEYVRDDGNATAFAYQGDNVTWNGTNSEMTYQFDTEEGYDSCDFTNSTALANGVTTVFESLPAGVNYKQRSKGAKFFGLNTCDAKEVCECSSNKIKIVFKPKKFKGTRKTECIGTELGSASGKGGFGKCKRQCKRAPGCMGLQFKKEGKKIFECITYSDIPQLGSSWTKGPGGCYGLRPLNVPKP